MVLEIIATVLAIGLVSLYVFVNVVLKEYAKGLYKKWKSYSSTLDVDAFVPAEDTPNYLKIGLLQSLSVGASRVPSKEAIPISSKPSPNVDGLLVTQRAADDKVVKVENDTKNVIVVGTIRMGFGHHRIAYAASSWAIDEKEVNETYFHDLLNVKSQEAALIESTDKVYSKLSRWSSNLGGFVESLWGKMMLSGNADALRISGLTAMHLTPLLQHYPKDTPIIATHCYVALAAVAAGFTNVINLVIDNHPQWFVVVPGCLNLVQGPVNYQSFLKMGVSPNNIQLAGHWIPKSLVIHIPTDTQTRITRLSSSKTKLRILIPVGGAGAQRKFIIQLVRALVPFVQSNQVQLLLNAGDHPHMKAAFVKVLQEFKISYTTVTSTQGVNDFQSSLLKEGTEPKEDVTLFAFDDYFPAVATTDILCRVSDVLACKPSELAFYPIPKLMIRRVGDHEQYSAIRAAELGDGTLEARTIPDCLSFLQNFLQPDSPLLTHMNTRIQLNHQQGIYDGCKNAVQIALQKSKKQS